MRRRRCEVEDQLGRREVGEIFGLVIALLVAAAPGCSDSDLALQESTAGQMRPDDAGVAESARGDAGQRERSGLGPVRDEAAPDASTMDGPDLDASRAPSRADRDEGSSHDDRALPSTDGSDAGFDASVVTPDPSGAPADPEDDMSDAGSQEDVRDDSFGEDPRAAVSDRYEPRDLLRSLAVNVLFPTYVDFAAAAEELQRTTATWATAAEAAMDAAGSTAQSQQAAREAYVRAMDAWQRAELMQLGPAALAPSVGGLGLRNAIYSWPLISACRVDQQTLDTGYSQGDFFISNLDNAYGMDALEYLVFVVDDQNQCNEALVINTEPSGWQSLSSREIDARRARYAAVIAAEVAEHARSLREAWDPDAGSFFTLFVEAGSERDAGLATYSGDQEALEAAFAAMLYLDLQVKDRKMAQPLGLSECADECLLTRESRWANRSKEYVRENLLAFEHMVLGGKLDDPERVGFDDALRAAGGGLVASELLDAVAGARAAVDAIPGSLGSAIADRSAGHARVVDAHSALKRITDILKGQFAQVLRLQLPEAAEGDSD